MYRPRWLVSAAAASVLASLSIVGMPTSQAATAGNRQNSNQQISNQRNAAFAEAALAKLRPTGYALVAEGRKPAEAALYAGAAFDSASGKVDLYLVDTKQYDRFLATAAIGTAVDASVVRLHSAKYSRATIVKAQQKAMAGGDRTKYGFATNSFIVPDDGSGLVVGVATADDKPLSAAQMTSAAAKLTAVAGIAVTVKYVKLARSKDRTGDTSPYYAGGLIQIRHSDGTWHDCTMGFTEHANGTTYVFTAAHCAHAGDLVENGRGQVIGYTVASNDTSDSAAINARGAQEEFDGGDYSYNIFSYSGTHYSVYGDIVHQDGYTSGITVSKVFIGYTCWYASGSYGITHSCGSVASAWGLSSIGVQGGDSGALVFNCPSSGCSSGNRAVAGLVSANYDNSDWNLAYSNELDILNYWGGSVW